MDVAQRLQDIVRNNLRKRDEVVQEFDSVVVGICKNVPSLCYSLVDLNLACKDENHPHAKINKIDDKRYKFTLFARTGYDFSSYEEADFGGGLSIYIAPLANFEGEIYSSAKKLVKEIIIEHPRMIVIKDGRIYVERNFKDFDPWKEIPEIINVSSEFFTQNGIWSPAKNDIKN